MILQYCVKIEQDMTHFAGKMIFYALRDLWRQGFLLGLQLLQRIRHFQLRNQRLDRVLDVGDPRHLACQAEYFPNCVRVELL